MIRCYVNGSLSDCLPVLDRGLAYGDGLFETMFFNGQTVPLLHLHQKRLIDSCERLAISLDIDKVQQQLEKVVAELREGDVGFQILKLIVSRGSGGRGYSPAGVNDCHIFIFARPWLAPTENAVHLSIAEVRLPIDPLFAGLKTLNALHYVMASNALKEDYTDALMLDFDSNVVETITRNLWVVEQATLVTPPLDKCGVAGVMRNYLRRNLAAELNLTVTEENVSIDRLRSAKEVFLSNAVQGITPVVEIENTATYSVGRVSTELSRRVECELGR